MKILRKISKHMMAAFLSFVYKFKFPYAPAPRMLSIEMTQLCNLKCSMCFREDVNVENANISIDEFKQVLDIFPKLKYLSLVGLGEILMYPYLPEAVKAAKDKGINVVITTNGTLLTEKNVKKLDGVDVVYVSMESANPERYKAIRGAELKDVVSGMRRLKREMPDVLLFIQAVMMQDNMADLPDFPGFAKEVDANGISFLHMLPLNSEQDKRHLTNVSDAEACLKKAGKSAKESGIEFYSRPLTPKEKYCNYPWTMPYITLKGDIYACPFVCRGEETSKEFYLGESVEVPSYQYKVGNIFKDDLKKIWNGKEMQLLRKKLAGYWHGGRGLSTEEFLKKRRETNLPEKFSYCDICLFRWGCAC